MNYFSYDALSSRFAVQEASGVSYFTWDQNGMNLLAERDASGSVTAYYTHGYTPTDGIGSLVAAKRNEAGASYYQYPVYDHRGSVVRLLDQNGSPTAYYEYDAWGNQLKDQVLSGTSSNRFRYQSNWIELKDSGGDLYLSPTRVYHAGVGRFLGRDLAGHLAGDYEYGNANPPVWVDSGGGAVAPAPGTKPKLKLPGPEPELPKPTQGVGGPPVKKKPKPSTSSGGITITRVSFTSLAPGTTIPTAPRAAAEWLFKLDKAAPCDGYFVQRIDWHATFLHCKDPRPVTTPVEPTNKKVNFLIPRDYRSYWEAWKVKKGDTLVAARKTKFGAALQLNRITDTADFEFPVPSKGSLVQKGLLKFFCDKVTGNLGDVGVPSTDKKSQFTIHGVAAAGFLPSTYNKPAWWDNVPDAGPVTRWLSSGWCWCCNGKKGDWVKQSAFP